MQRYPVLWPIGRLLLATLFFWPAGKPFVVLKIDRMRFLP